MSFVIYRVTADYVTPRDHNVIGCGAECKTFAEAMQYVEKYEANDKLTNVELIKTRYGA